MLDESKHYLLEARLSPIVKDEGAGSLDGLWGLIRATSRNGLRERIVEAMTTNETLFFRDITPFDTLRTLIIPELTRGETCCPHFGRLLALPDRELIPLRCYGTN